MGLKFQEKFKMNPDHLKCPVCKEIFDGKVFILRCGHNLCSTCLPKLYQHQDYNDSDYDGEDSENDYNDDHASLMKSQVKCPVCNTITKCKKKSNGTLEGITRNVTIESITEDYREKNGLLTSLDKERKDNLLKKGQKMVTELDEKMKFLEIAEKLLARKSDIVEVQNSISTLLDDFNKNWENDGPQALSFSNWKDSANYHQIVIKDGEQVEQVIKHVGPIWGQYEAGAKVRRYLESSGMQNWEWTGHWNSEGGTSYAQ